ELGWGVIDNILNLSYLEDKKVLDKQYADLKELEHFGKATQQDIANYKTKYVAYWERYFKERMRLNSDCVERFDEDMERKLRELEVLPYLVVSSNFIGE
nr:hypothetical protein [Flavobacteriaceae bacterium]